ncbi:MAG: hypothetical protein HPY83_13875 [Anaerolineae bacterium]|nr:hypothetical protein [Anaerolineae bacterium]
MRIVGFEQGRVTVQLDAAECSVVAEALRLVSRQLPLEAQARRPLGDAFAVCARIAAAQSRQALALRLPRPPLAFARQQRSIVSVD